MIATTHPHHRIHPLTLTAHSAELKRRLAIRGLQLPRPRCQNRRFGASWQDEDRSTTDIYSAHPSESAVRRRLRHQSCPTPKPTSNPRRVARSRRRQYRTPPITGHAAHPATYPGRKIPESKSASALFSRYRHTPAAHPPWGGSKPTRGQQDATPKDIRHSPG